jgi:hypothetical protein
VRQTWSLAGRDEHHGIGSRELRVDGRPNRRVKVRLAEACSVNTAKVTEGKEERSGLREAAGG